MTRFTNDMALREMSQKYIKPMRSVIIIATVNVTMKAVRIWNPISRNVITNIDAWEKKNKKIYR